MRIAWNKNIYLRLVGMTNKRSGTDKSQLLGNHKLNWVPDPMSSQYLKLTKLFYIKLFFEYAEKFVDRGCFKF